MDFQLTNEQRMLKEMAADFAARELAPNVEKWDEESYFPKEAVKKMGELGLMGIMTPEELGGAGLDTMAYVIALEEIASVCASTAVTMSVNNSLYLDCLKKFCNESQQKKYMPDWARGLKLGAYALTEPGAGTDAASQKTTAVLKGDRYILNGTKNFITNGPAADCAVIFAMTDKTKGVRGISAFIVERTFPGYSIGNIEDKLGIRASCTSEIVLEDCEVPKENLILNEGDGFKVAMATLDGGRIGIATQALGIARAAFEAAARYANVREAFGKPIGAFEGIQWKLADMVVGVESSRFMVYKAAWLKDQEMKYSAEAAMAKLYASDVAMKVTREAIQVFGGYGYCKQYAVERYYRDAKITEIYEGTSEVQRMVISRAVLDQYK